MRDECTIRRTLKSWQIAQDVTVLTLNPEDGGLSPTTVAVTF